MSDELYKQEQEEALKEAQERENIRRQAIPGLIKPEAFERKKVKEGEDDDEDEEF